MVQSAFIGREAELGVLLEAYGRAASRQGNIVLLEGGAGVGKSTLVDQLITRVREQPPTHRLSEAIGYCYEGGTDSPYYPWIEALSQLVTAGPERSVVALTLDLLKQVGPDLLRIIPVLGDAAAAGLKALSVAGEWWLAAAPKDDAIVARNIPLQFTDTVVALAEAQGPMILVLEDAHWADAASAQLLLRLSHRIAAVPILVVATYRRDETSESPFAKARRELISSGGTSIITLKPFSENEISRYLDVAYGSDIARSLTSWMVELSGGQPLFVKNYLDLLERDGSLLPGIEGRMGWTLGSGIEGLTIPRTVAEVLEARLARLQVDERRMLQLSSIQGQKFHVVLTAELMSTDEMTVLDALKDVARREELLMLRPADAWTDEWTDTFSFSSQLLQRVLYDEFTKRERSVWHKRVGRALLDQIKLTSQAAPVHVLIATANHLSVGRQYAPASELYLDSARFSYDAGAFADTSQLCERALSCLSSLSSLSAGGLDAEMRLVRARCIQLWLLSSELRWWGEAQNTELGQSANDLLTIGDEDATALGDLNLKAQMTFLRARLAIIRESLPAALQLYEAALQETRRAGDELGELVTLTEYGHHTVGVDLQKGLRTLRNAYEMWERLQPSLEAMAPAPILARHLHRLQGSIGVAEFDNGQFDEAEHWLRSALEGLRLRRMPDLHSIMSNFLAQLLTAEGRFEEAERVLVETLDELRTETTALIHRGLNQALLGKLYLEWERPDEARSNLEQAFTRTRNVVNEAVIPLIDNYYCEWLTDELNPSPDRELAESLLRHTVAEVERSQFLRSGVGARMLLARVLLATGRESEALQVSQQAVDILEQNGTLPALRSEEVWFTHSRVLHHNLETASALGYQSRASRVMRAKAASIADDSRRYQFLQRIRLNRKIGSLAGRPEEWR